MFVLVFGLVCFFWFCDGCNVNLDGPIHTLHAVFKFVGLEELGCGLIGFASEIFVPVFQALLKKWLCHIEHQFPTHLVEYVVDYFGLLSAGTVGVLVGIVVHVADVFGKVILMCKIRKTKISLKKNRSPRFLLVSL